MLYNQFKTDDNNSMITGSWKRPFRFVFQSKIPKYSRYQKCTSFFRKIIDFGIWMMLYVGHRFRICLKNHNDRLIMNALWEYEVQKTGKSLLSILYFAFFYTNNVVEEEATTEKRVAFSSGYLSQAFDVFSSISQSSNLF